jgi:putative PEP-CTERM system TPR-repeat lipoprotein
MKTHATKLLVGLLLILSGCDITKSTEDYITSAQHYQDKGDLPSAIIELKNAVKKSPNDPLIRIKLGTLYYEQNRYVLASTELARAGELGSPAPQWQLLKLQSLMEQRDNQGILDEVIALNQYESFDRVHIITLKGIAAQKLGLMDQAVAYFEQASLATPENPFSKLSQAYLAQTRDQLDQALQLLDEALNADPDLTQARLLRAQLLGSAGQSDAAIDELKQLVAQHPHDMSYQLMLAESLLHSNQVESARPLIETILKASPKHPYTNLLAAQMNFHGRHYDESKRQAQQVLSAIPNNIVARAILGLSLFQLGENEQSTHHLTQVSANLPLDHPLRKSIAQAQFLMGNTEQVAVNLESYSVQSKADLKLLSTLALGLAERQELPLALELMDKVYQSSPSNETLAQVGLLKLANQDRQGLADLAQAMASDPNLKQYRYAPAIYHITQLEYEQATEQANAWLGHADTAADGHNVHGLVHIAKGESELAIGAFNQTLLINPHHPIALNYLARLYSQTQPSKAIEHAKTLLALNPNNLQTLSFLAQLEFTQGNTAQAHQYFTDRLTATGSNDAATVHLAYARFLSHNQYYQESLTQLAAQSAAAQEAAATARLNSFNYFQLGQLDRSMVAAEQWLKRSSQESAAYFSVLELAIKLNKTSRVASIVEQTRSRFPDEPRFVLMGARYFAQSGNYEQARRMVRTLQDTRLKQALLAELHGQKGEYAQAVALQQQVVKAQRDSYAVRRLAGYQKQQGEIAQAKQTLKDWIEVSGEDTQARLQLANLLIANSPDEAIKAYQKILIREPSHLVALNNLAWLQAQGNQLTKARQTIDKALEIGEQDANVLDTYGYILLKQQQPKPAIVAFKKALDFAPEQHEIRLNLARAYLAQHDEKLAKTTLQTILKQEILAPQIAEEAQYLLSRIN